MPGTFENKKVLGHSSKFCLIWLVSQQIFNKEDLGGYLRRCGYSFSITVYPIVWSIGRTE